jgi:hypothetical protein
MLNYVKNVKILFCNVSFQSSKVTVGNDSPDMKVCPTIRSFLNCNYLKPKLLRGTPLSYIA